MYALFVTLVLSIGLLGTVGWSVYTLQKQSEISSLTQRNASRVEGMASLMKAALRYDPATATFMVPFGGIAASTDDATNGRMVLPTGVVGDDRTPWGGEYGFCPVWNGPANAVPSDRPATVKGGSTTDQEGNRYDQTYGVSVRTLLDDHANSLSYVDGMQWNGAPTQSGPDIAGFIVSPAPNSTAIPNCGDIVLKANPDGNRYYVISGPNSSRPSVQGSVTVISGAGIVKTLSLSQASNPVVYASTTGAGLKNGADPTDAMPLQDALAYWHDAYPVGMTVRLVGGNYAVTSEQVEFTLPNPGVAASNVSASRGYLDFEGPTDGTLATIVGAGNVEMHLGVNAQFGGGIALDPSVTLVVGQGVQASVNTVGGLGPVVVEGGAASITAPSLQSALLKGGTLDATLGGTAGSLVVTGGTAQVSAQSIGSIMVGSGYLWASASGVGPTSLVGAGANLTLAYGGNVKLSSLAMTAATLTVDAANVALGSAPAFDVNSGTPTLTFLDGGTVGYNSQTYATATAFMNDFWQPLFLATAPAASCGVGEGNNADGSTDIVCTATCPVTNPYPVGGDCLATEGSSTPTLASFGKVPPGATSNGVATTPGGFFCRWHPTSVEVADEVTAQIPPVGTAQLRCSSVAR